MNTRRVSRKSAAGKRQYRSALRTAQARETRRAIVSAASHLFMEKGFGATTIDAVAEAAGVSRKTVFTAVGGKVELLKLTIDWAVAGDDDPVALADRPALQALLRDPDPAVLLAGWIAVQVDIDSRVAALHRALDIAADTDAAARSLRRRFDDQRLQGARMIVDRLIELDALMGSVTADEAVDLAWLATDPALYERLVRDRRWSAKRFEKWLARSLIRDMLGYQTGDHK